MVSGPSHPNEQLALRRRGKKTVDGKKNSTEAAAAQPEAATETPVADTSNSIGPGEQAAITVTGEIIDLPSGAPKPRGKNGAGSESGLASGRLRFNVSLQAKLVKNTEFSVGIFSADKNRGEVVVESIHVGIHRKGESLFDGDVPIGKDGKVNPGAKKVIPFSDGQKKQLSRALKAKTFASVTAVYTAPAQTEVTLSIGKPDSKKKKTKG